MGFRMVRIATSETIGKNEKFGHYRQSERKELYKQYADRLIASGNAYYAFDTPWFIGYFKKTIWNKKEKRLFTTIVIERNFE